MPATGSEGQSDVGSCATPNQLLQLLNSYPTEPSIVLTYSGSSLEKFGWLEVGTVGDSFVLKLLLFLNFSRRMSSALEGNTKGG